MRTQADAKAENVVVPDEVLGHAWRQRELGNRVLAPVGSSAIAATHYGLRATALAMPAAELQTLGCDCGPHRDAG